jgi:hypothetical protein
MLSPARKKNIALLNLSSIKPSTDEKKCISVPYDRKTNFCFPFHKKKYFD